MDCPVATGNPYAARQHVHIAMWARDICRKDIIYAGTLVYIKSWSIERAQRKTERRAGPNVGSVARDRFPARRMQEIDFRDFPIL